METPYEEFKRRLAANDSLIRGASLENGRLIAHERTLIYTDLVNRWAGEQHQRFGYERPFAVVALGGTGRGEVTPCSDLDFAFLFDDLVEENPFLLELQRQTIHSGEFARDHGFGFEALPFNLEDIMALEGKQLNSFLDMRPVYDPGNLSTRFRERIRETFDPFEHFLHVQNFWKDRWEKASAECERLDRFDIKNDGLRVFLAGIWTLGGESFAHSHEVYGRLDDPRDLAAYHFLLRIRSFVHARHAGKPRPAPTGNHPEDVWEFDDFDSFGELLGADVSEEVRFEFAATVRSRVLSARRRVAQFSNGVFGQELSRGRRHCAGSAIVYGGSGLRYRSVSPVLTPEARTRAALSLLLASQRYSVPIDRAELETTFRNAGDWLVPVPELGALFYEPRGSLAGSFEFLSRIDGAEDRLFPGYAKFEGSLDDRVMTERKLLRSALERQKMIALELLVREGQIALQDDVSMAHKQTSKASRTLSDSVEAALLDPDHLAAVKLALKTKRLPLTLEDQRLREDPSRPLHERFSTGFSGIPLEAYYTRSFEGCGFSAETLDVARFLVSNRRAFKQHAAEALNDSERVRELQELCGNESRLRALFVFSSADRAFWESEADDPARWRNTRELYWKTMQQFHPELEAPNVLTTAGYSRDELQILRDFGDDFFSGLYGVHANRFGSHLLRLAQEPGLDAPKVTLLREGASTILGIATRDFRGLAACISGTLWHMGIPLRQAHLFSAASHGLALDFFHLARMTKSIGPHEFRAIEESIKDRRYLNESADEPLQGNAEAVSLEEIRPGLHRLTAETSGEIGAFIYLMTLSVFRYLEGNVFGLSVQPPHAGHRARVTVYHSLPATRTLQAARAILAERL
jgi:hypothetical protein